MVKGGMGHGFDLQMTIKAKSVLPGSGDTSLQFSFLHTLRDKKHRDRILVKILLNLRTTLYDLSQPGADSGAVGW